MARNTLLNLLGFGAPLVVAMAATPVLVRALGTERFGILTMGWAVIGYFSLFDLGLGRALTQVVSERLGAGREDEVAPATWTANALLLALGVAGGALLAVTSGYLARSVLKIPPQMQDEAVGTFRLLALSLPFVTSTAGLRGVLESYQRFGLVNAIRVPMGLVSYLGPLAVLPFSHSMVPVVAVLAAGRIAAWGVHVVFCLRTIPALGGARALQRAMVRPLLRFGGWLTASNVSSSLMMYFDRFVIGAVLSMSAVAYYATPYELASRVQLLPGAVTAVFFPAFATIFVNDRRRSWVLFDSCLRAMTVVLFPVILALVTLAPDVLRLWLGADFAQHGTRVLQWIAAGVLVNSAGVVAATALQGAGRPEATGKLNMLELPLYMAALWALLRARGVEGAAIAWALRMGVDTAALFWLSARWGVADRATVRRGGLLLAGVLPVLWAGAMVDSPAHRLVFLAVACAAFLAVAWTRVLSVDERAGARRWLAAARPGVRGAA
jgi:O-antigen/teichoic acid export membrane protein